MNEAQRTVANIALAALTQDHDQLARLINELPRRQVRDATAHALTLLVAGLKPCFTDDDWQGLIQDGRLALLDLEMEN